MKNKRYILSLIIVAIIFFLIGFCVGKDNNSNLKSKQKIVEKKEYIEAYRQGWSYWFSGYGMHGEGAQYVNLYTYGRRYNDKYYQEHDAFIAGYNDGSCYVNRCDAKPIGQGNGIAEKGYEQYYQIDESKKKGSSISKIIKYTSETIIGGISGNDTTIIGLIRSEELRNELEKNKIQYPDLINGTLVERLDEKGFTIKVTMYCGELEKNQCSKSLDHIMTFINNNQLEIYKDFKITINIMDQ